MNYNPFLSKTNWTVLVMFLLQYGPLVDQLVPAQWKPLVEGVLAVLAFYFHTSTAVKAGAVN